MLYFNKSLAAKGCPVFKSNKNKMKGMEARANDVMLVGSYNGSENYKQLLYKEIYRYKERLHKQGVTVET